MTQIIINEKEYFINDDASIIINDFKKNYSDDEYIQLEFIIEFDLQYKYDKTITLDVVNSSIEIFNTNNKVKKVRSIFSNKNIFDTNKIILIFKYIMYLLKFIIHKPLHIHKKITDFSDNRFGQKYFLHMASLIVFGMFMLFTFMINPDIFHKKMETVYKFKFNNTTTEIVKILDDNDYNYIVGNFFNFKDGQGYSVLKNIQKGDINTILSLSETYIITDTIKFDSFKMTNIILIVYDDRLYNISLVIDNGGNANRLGRYYGNKYSLNDCCGSKYYNKYTDIEVTSNVVIINDIETVEKCIKSYNKKLDEELTNDFKDV